MDLAKLMVASKTITMEYPGSPDFMVDVAYLTRDELVKLKDKATTQKFNKRTRQPEDELDSELFQDLYIQAVIKGWNGLKYKYLGKLLPVDLTIVPKEEYKDGEGLFPFTKDNATTLMKNCSDFDSWISAELEEVENFTQSS